MWFHKFKCILGRFTSLWMLDVVLHIACPLSKSWFTVPLIIVLLVPLRRSHWTGLITWLVWRRELVCIWVKVFMLWKLSWETCSLLLPAMLKVKMSLKICFLCYMRADGTMNVFVHTGGLLGGPAWVTSIILKFVGHYLGFKIKLAGIFGGL